MVNLWPLPIYGFSLPIFNSYVSHNQRARGNETKDLPLRWVADSSLRCGLHTEPGPQPAHHEAGGY